MDKAVSRLIEEKYNCVIQDVVAAPRQFVAETYILKVSSNTKYFCKTVDKPLFIPHIIASLPILQALNQSGFRRINHPIATHDNELYVMNNSTLIVLFNYIDAPQSYAYDIYAFGALLGTLHKSTNKMTVPIGKEDFIYKYASDFNILLTKHLSYSGSDDVLTRLRTVLSKYQDEIRHDYVSFVELGNKLRNKKTSMVITHGDPGGNTLVKDHTDLYLIDGDDMMLAPPERDLWFFKDKAGFLEGYRSIFPKYRVNQNLIRFFIYKRFFEDLVEYFAEIDSQKPLEHRLKNLHGLDNDCMNGWLRPVIRQFDPISKQ